MVEWIGGCEAAPQREQMSAGGCGGRGTEIAKVEKERREEGESGWSLMLPCCRCVVGLYNIITPMSLS